jgi:hypothetical protein
MPSRSLLMRKLVQLERLLRPQEQPPQQPTPATSKQQVSDSSSCSMSGYRMSAQRVTMASMLRALAFYTYGTNAHASSPILLKFFIPCTQHIALLNGWGSHGVMLTSWCLVASTSAGAHRSQSNSRCVPLSSVSSSSPTRHALPAAAPVSNSNLTTIQQRP